VLLSFFALFFRYVEQLEDAAAIGVDASQVDHRVDRVKSV